MQSTGTCFWQGTQQCEVSEVRDKAWNILETGVLWFSWSVENTGMPGMLAGARLRRVMWVFHARSLDFIQRPYCVLIVGQEGTGGNAGSRKPT